MNIQLQARNGKKSIDLVEAHQLFIALFDKIPRKRITQNSVSLKKGK